ncbi:hypothetical protein [Paenibacillus planticolens]|nr:hypothetical protein [Paenibacillus planticolens]
MKKLIHSGYAGSFDMIYLDGPFNSGRIFTMQVQGTDVELANPWQELKSIHFYEKPELYLADYKARIELARKLLSDRGVLVLQISQKEGHYLKVLLDTFFIEITLYVKSSGKSQRIPIHTDVSLAYRMNLFFSMGRLRII